RKLEPWKVVLVFRDLLNALDRCPKLVRGFDHLVQDVANDLVTIGGDSDFLPRLRQRANHAGANMRLSGTRGTLDRKHAAIEVRCDAHRCSKASLLRMF